MKSSKFKITAIAIIATLTFATSAFAGIFDVVGAVVGGVLGVTTQPTQEQLENFHKDYLNKVASKIKQTGDVDGAVADVITEQKKICNVSTVQNDKGQVVSAEISGGNLPVTVKCSIDRQQQLLTISYLNSDGTSVGNTLTKKYELPGGADTVAAQPNNNFTQAEMLANEGNEAKSAVNSSQPATVISVNLLPQINKQISSLPVNTSNYMAGEKFNSSYTLSGLNNGQTGFSLFDNSLMRGNFELAAEAYLSAYLARQGTNRAIPTKSINAIAKKSDPFVQSKLQKIYQGLVDYYKQGNRFDGWELNIMEVLCPRKVEYLFDIEAADKLDRFTYDTTRQKYCFTLYDSGTSWNSEDYVINIPVAQAQTLYKKLKTICDQNKINYEKIRMSKKRIALPVTMIRVCHAGDTKIGDDDYNNAYLIYKVANGTMYGSGYNIRYNFSAAKMKDLATFSQIKAHKRYHLKQGESYY